MTRMMSSVSYLFGNREATIVSKDLFCVGIWGKREEKEEEELKEEK